MKKEKFITSFTHQIAINNVVDYIEDHICEKIELDHLAQVANLSKFHFLRTFKSSMSETPLQFINRLRLEKIASSLLSRPNDSIASIANEFGYTDLTNFSKNFKIQFGVTATIWRQKNKNIDEQSDALLNKSLEHYYANSMNIGIETKTIKNKSIEIKVIKPFTVVYYRHYGSYIRTDKLHEKMWTKLLAWADLNNYLSNPELKTIVVYHDDPNLTIAERQRMSFCLSVPDNIKFDSKIGKMIIEGGKYVVAKFELKRNELILAWDWVMKWLPESGLEPDKKYCFEMYSENSQPGLFNIDIYMPIRETNLYT